MSLILHCGGNAATYNDIKSVPLPAETDSYGVVAHQDLTDQLLDLVAANFGDVEVESSFGLAQDGQQLFGLLRVPQNRTDEGLVIGFRNSYNKTLSVGIVGGLRVTVCDNLLLCGDEFEVVRKHTKNVWQAVVDLATVSIAGSGAAYLRASDELEKTRHIPVGQEEGYEFLGRAIGHGVLTGPQAAIAFGDWNEPRHEEFGERNLYSLYNCATEGLKKGAVSKAITRHTEWHSFVRDAFPAIAA